jgi:hypothetical protein
VFYVPTNNEVLYNRLRELIEAHGGMVVEYLECFAYQIFPNSDQSPQKRNFFSGSIYLESWITKHIEDHMKSADPMNPGGAILLNSKAENLFTMVKQSNKTLKINIGKGKRFTILEGLMMFTIISSHSPSNLSKINFWQSIEEQMMIPERTPEQMRNFYKEYGNYTTEQWLVLAIHRKVEFSFSIRYIPNKDFLQQFRQRYLSEFNRLKQLDHEGMEVTDNDFLMKRALCADQMKQTLSHSNPDLTDHDGPAQDYQPQTADAPKNGAEGVKSKQRESRPSLWNLIQNSQGKRDV